jgi:hypothetical protein
MALKPHSQSLHVVMLQADVLSAAALAGGDSDDSDDDLPLAARSRQAAA